MNVLRRVVFIGLVVGVVFATASVGLANPNVSYNDCQSTAPPTPTPTPAVTPPVTAPPSSASPTPAPKPTPAPDDCMPLSKSVLRGTHTLAFTVSSDGFHPVKTVSLSVLADSDPNAHDAGQLFSFTYNCNGNQPDPSKPILVPWDTTSDTPYNGRYKVSISASEYGDPTCAGNGHTTSPKPRDDLIVDNPPASVSAPRVIAATSSTITIGWDASTAKDFARYEIYRAATSSSKTPPQTKDFKLWGYTTSTSFRDSQVPPGTYWYGIVVTRRSFVTPDTGISSPLSDPSKPATIAAPPVHNNPGSAPPPFRRYIPLNPIVLPPSRAVTAAPVPDAPYSAQLPYASAPEDGGGGAANGSGTNSESGANDPRGPVLPVAVGAFLVSAALALGRMPY